MQPVGQNRLAQPADRDRLRQERGIICQIEMGKDRTGRDQERDEARDPVEKVKEQDEGQEEEEEEGGSVGGVHE